MKYSSNNFRADNIAVAPQNSTSHLFDENRDCKLVNSAKNVYPSAKITTNSCVNNQRLLSATSQLEESSTGSSTYSSSCFSPSELLSSSFPKKSPEPIYANARIYENCRNIHYSEAISEIYEDPDDLSSLSYKPFTFTFDNPHYMRPALCEKENLYVNVPPAVETLRGLYLCSTPKSEKNPRGDEFINLGTEGFKMIVREDNAKRHSMFASSERQEMFTKKRNKRHFIKSSHISNGSYSRNFETVNTSRYSSFTPPSNPMSFKLETREEYARRHNLLHLLEDSGLGQPACSETEAESSLTSRARDEVQDLRPKSVGRQVIKSLRRVKKIVSKRMFKQ